MVHDDAGDQHQIVQGQKTLMIAASRRMTARSSELDTDVLIVGAGAAGLAAAAELSAAGLSAAILEARDRTGGRIHTRTDAYDDVPIELGAEFVHGRSDIADEWMAASRTLLVDATTTRCISVGGEICPADLYFERMKRALQKLRRPTRDLPFAEFLERVDRRILDRRSRELAVALVEGFDAADASRVSTRDTLASWAGSAAADAPTFRPRDGYAVMLDAIRARFGPQRIDLRLNCTIKEIIWRRGRVHGRLIDGIENEAMEMASKTLT